MGAGQGDSLLPSFLFSTGAYSQREGFDAWAAEVSPLFGVATDDESRTGFSGAIEGFLLDGIVVSNVCFDGQRYVRDRRLAARSVLDSYLVQYYAEGGFCGTADDAEVSVKGGDVCIFDLTATLSTCAQRSSGVTLVIPKDLVDRHWRGGVSVNGLTLSSQESIGRLLGAHLATLGRCAATTRAEEAGTIALGVAQLIASSMAFATSSREFDPKPLQLALFQRAATYIRANLPSPSLSPQTICAALRVSRAHLYRAFEQHGGVNSYIQDQRLMLAYRELRNPANRHETIGAIAYRCGFASDAHFSQSFREVFGVRPRSVRDEPTAGTASLPDSHGLPAWLGGA